MAVTTTTQTVSSLPYTATDFAAAIRLAFIDAGWMTDWHAAFTNGGIVNRVMRVNHGTAETYCNTNYWFQFSGADMFFHIARGWNTSTNIPQGVSGVGAQYLDFLNTSTSTTTNHMRFALFNANQSITIVCHKSGSFSVVVVKQGTTEFNIILDKSSLVATSVDLSKVCYMGLMFARARVSGGVGGINLQYYSPKLKGSHFGNWLRNIISGTQYGASNTASFPWEVGSGDAAFNPQMLYGYIGNEDNSTANALNLSNLSIGGMYLVGVGFTNVNPDYAGNYSPPFLGMTINAYTTAQIPADFVVFASYTNNTLQTFDPITVVTGVEVYQVITVANSTALNTRPTVVFAARTV